MKNILLIFFIFLSLINADSTFDKFKHEEIIKVILTDYFKNVDEKNIEGILDHLTSELIMNFGSDGVTRIKSKTEFYPIFESWSKSSKGQFSFTRIDSINIQETHIVKNYTAVADVTYTRMDKNRNPIRTERSLYHFVRGTGYYGKPLKFIWEVMIKWLRPWKIYMISNIALDWKHFKNLF